MPTAKQMEKQNHSVVTEFILMGLTEFHELQILFYFFYYLHSHFIK